MCFINSFILQYLSDIYYIIGTILGAGVITLNNTKFLLSHAQFLVDRQETKKNIQQVIYYEENKPG